MIFFKKNTLYYYIDFHWWRKWLKTNCWNNLISVTLVTVGFTGSSDSGVCLRCRRPRFSLSVRKTPWGREWLPAPVFFAWRMPWTEEPGRLQPMGLQKIRHNWAAYTCDHGEAMEFDGGCIRKMCCGRNRNVLVRVSSARLPPDTLLCPHVDCVLGFLPSHSAAGWK